MNGASYAFGMVIAGGIIATFSRVVWSLFKF